MKKTDYNVKFPDFYKSGLCSSQAGNYNFSKNIKEKPIAADKGRVDDAMSSKDCLNPRTSIAFET